MQKKKNILRIRQRNPDVISPDSIENLERLPHIHEIIRIMDIQEPSSKLGGLVKHRKIFSYQPNGKGFKAEKNQH